MPAEEGQSFATISQSFDWYAEGQARTVVVRDCRITVRFIGRKGRRVRIAIAAPAGAVFDSWEPVKRR